MEQALQDFLKEKIYNYLQNDVEFEGNEMHDYKEVEWLWGEKTVIVDLEIYGYNKHDRGDRDNPPTDSGKIEADVDCVVVVDEDNVTEYRDTKELSTTYEY